MTGQLAVLAVLVAVFVAFCAGMLVSDVCDWYYRRKSARRQAAWDRHMRNERELADWNRHARERLKP